MNEHPIHRIAVIGAGLMGHGIALEFAVAGYDVRLHDLTAEALQQATGRIAAGLQRLEQLGLVTSEQRSRAPERIQVSVNLPEAVGDADLVIESAVENLEVKRRIFAELDQLCPARAILASNSSSFVPSAYGSSTRRPAIVLGIHYFNPPYLLPCVELIAGPQTSDATVETVCALLKKVGKQPVLIRKEVPGFIANRLQAALFREALSLVDRGIATPEDIDDAVRYGIGRRFATAGPFEIFDLAGLDTVLAAGRGLIPDLASTTAVSALLEAKVARGELGVKTGKGFYEWTADSAATRQQEIAAGIARVTRGESARPMKRNPFAGTWRLVSFTARAPDGQTHHPLGQDSAGRLIYTATGHMGVVLSRASRPRFVSDDVLGGSQQEKATAMDSYLSYSGTYEVLPDRVVHRIEFSSFPNWIGTEQVRHFVREGNRLTLTTPPIPSGGRTLVSRLVWERIAEPPTGLE